MSVKTSFSSSRAFSFLLWLGLAVWVLALFLQKTNLAASDLGRHVMNGSVIVQTGQVFQDNHYSFTHPDYTAPNHHWLFGVIVYYLHLAGGFPLITLVVALTYWLGVVLTGLFAKQVTDSRAALLAVFLLLPVITMRVETRPEAFSVLGLSLTLLLCYRAWELTTAKSRSITAAALFVITIFWVNLHILFVLGFLVTGVYFLYAFINKSRAKIYTYGLLLLTQLTAAMLNPLGWKTILYPFQIFRDYQYPVAENQSITFFLSYHPSPVYIYLAIVLIFIAILLVLSFKKVPIRLRPTWIITSVLLLATAAMTRMSAFFQLTAIIVLAANLQLLLPRLAKRLHTTDGQLHPVKTMGLAVMIVIVLAGMIITDRLNPFGPAFGLGILPQVEGAGTFFKTHQLPGPIFNNYDIGGYLIYMLYPERRVFVDNRPEAYPGSFMRERYIAGQEQEAVWQELEDEYHFNTIFFYRHDATDWAVPFLVKRIEDESWIPIYVDGYSLILIKDTPENAPFIQKFALPKSLFSIQKNQ